ncbi:MAG: electron transfer flavoprotein subunit alpha/FixB family protein [Endomicrobium sp.]|jgi:electron transfer flavoprotein alpha subunit|nr:electron transfer flavoprotein subunit alpha/FixB family protein [Endomicrobium sp.]
MCKKTNIDICLYAEYNRGHIDYMNTYNLITTGQTIASKLNVSIGVIIIGYHIDIMQAQRLINIGANKIYVIDNKLFYIFKEDIYKCMLLEILNKINPKILLFSHTATSKLLASMIAAELYTGIIVSSNINELNIDIKKNKISIWKKNAILEIPYSSPKIITIRPSFFAKAKVHQLHKSGTIIKYNDFKISNLDNITCILNCRKNIHSNLFANLSCASIVVGVGRGVYNCHCFNLIKEFADLINGTIGASKPAVDFGLVPSSNKIGETGVYINPRIYIACGISGDIKHTVGISKNSIIIAINIDPECEMMKIANFALHGNLYDIVRQLIKQIQYTN